MLFEWYWFPLYYIIIRHVFWIVHTIYTHRHFFHDGIEVSKGFETFSRIYLWLNGLHWPNWRRDFWCLHNYHHQNSDNDNDPHSPWRFTFKQLCQNKDIREGNPWYVPDDFKKKNHHIKNFNDDLEKFLVRHTNHGQLVLGLGCLLLYGPLAAAIGVPLYYLAHRYGMIWSSILLPHGVGTTKILDYKNPNDRNSQAVNYFPIGLFQCGEEFHSNHHAAPGNPKYSHQWWELDMGYVYARILEKFGLVKIKGR